MKKLIAAIFILLTFASLAYYIIAQEKNSLQPDQMLAQLTGEITYQEILKCVDLCAAKPSLLENFYRLYLFPSKKWEALKNLSDFPLSIDIDIESGEEQKRYLHSVHVQRKSADWAAWVHLGYNDQQDAVYFGEGRVTVQLYPNKNLKSVEAGNLDGRVDVHLDEKMRITSDRSRKYSSAEKTEVLQNRKKFADAIADSARHADVPLDKKINAASHTPSTLEKGIVLTGLKRIENYLQAIKQGSIKQLMENAIFQKNSKTIYVMIREHLGLIRFVSVFRGEMWADMEIGIFFEFDEQGRIVRYVEGNIKFDLNESGKTVAQTAIIPKDGSAVEIKFHSSGYPSSYKTLVRNRLFGRQMEWNEKGDVLSDVDLDIPTELPEIRKALDEENKNSPPR